MQKCRRNEQILEVKYAKNEIHFYQRFFFPEHGANGKTQSLQYRGKFVFFRSNSKSPVQGKIVIFLLKLKVVQYRGKELIHLRFRCQEIAAYNFQTRI